MPYRSRPKIHSQASVRVFVLHGTILFETSSTDGRYSSCRDGMSSFCQHCTERNRGNVIMYRHFFYFASLISDIFCIGRTVLCSFSYALPTCPTHATHKHDCQLFRVAASMSLFGQFQISTNVTALLLLSWTLFLPFLFYESILSWIRSLLSHWLQIPPRRHYLTESSTSRLHHYSRWICTSRSCCSPSIRLQSSCCSISSVSRY
jgi:hypothetical protein